MHTPNRRVKMIVDKNLSDIEDKDIYEISYHVIPTEISEEISAIVSKIKSTLSDAGGSIVAEGFSKLVNLSYPISDVNRKIFNRANFGWLKFEINKFNALKFKAEVSSMPEVLRSLLVKTIKENTFYSVKQREDEIESTHIPASAVQGKLREVSAEEIDKSIDELVIN